MMPAFRRAWPLDVLPTPVVLRTLQSRPSPSAVRSFMTQPSGAGRRSVCSPSSYAAGTGRILLGRLGSQPVRPPSSVRAFSCAAPAQATLSQALRGKRKPRIRPPKAPALAGKPQRKAVCSKIFTVKPRKPNSAERKVAKVKLADGSAITAYIMGEGHNLQEHSVVLVRGGRTVDLVGVKYRLVRGALDFNGVTGRTTSRSLYGVKKAKLAAK